MPDRKYFVKGEQLISSTAPRDHVQFTHQGYRAFDDEESAKRHVASVKAAATRAAKREAEAPAPSAPKAEWVAYAVRRGMPQARAEQQTKAQLVKEYTGAPTSAATSTAPAAPDVDAGGDTLDDTAGGDETTTETPAPGE